MFPVVGDHLDPSGSRAARISLSCAIVHVHHDRLGSRSGSHGLRFLCWGGRTAAGIQASPPMPSEAAERDGSSQRKWHGLTSTHPRMSPTSLSFPSLRSISMHCFGSKVAPNLIMDGWIHAWSRSLEAFAFCPFAATVSFSHRSRPHRGRTTNLP